MANCCDMMAMQCKSAIFSCTWNLCRFMIIPEMLKNAPMFKRIDPKSKVRCAFTG